MEFKDNEINKRTDFTPLDLNEENVKKILTECLADSNSVNLSGPILFKKDCRICRRF